MCVVLFTELISKNGGGSQIAVLNYAQGLMKLGIQPVVVSINSAYSKETLAEKNIQHMLLEPTVTGNITFSLLKAYKYVKSLHPRMLVVNELFSTFWIGLICGKLLQVPTLIYFHTYYFKNRETSSRVLNNIVKCISLIYTKFCLGLSKHIAVPSQAAKDFLVDSLNINPVYIKICPYPIFQDTRTTIPLKTYNKEKIKFIYAGRLVKGKNIHSIIQTCAALKDTNWDLTIIGNGTDEMFLKNLVNNLGLSRKVRFLPFLPREKLLEAYAQYDYFISLSNMETFGLTYMEALKCGLPVIALRYATTQELFSSIPQVFLIKEGPPEDMAKQIESFVQNARYKKVNPIPEAFFSMYIYENAATRLISCI